MADNMADHHSVAAQDQPNPILNEEQDAQDQLEAESWDDDSAYGHSTRSSFLTSLASEVTRGMFENGRRYHSYGTGEYAFPNDERETDRLDMQHAMMTALLHNRLFWAPLEPDVHTALDIGTGTGIWAIEFAELLPNSDIVGTDLSPIQPSWTPPNCRFEIDDCERTWTFPEQHFEYIHARNLVCSIRDWPKLMSQCYNHVKPGGWVEFQTKDPDIISADGTLPEGSALQKWSELFFAAADRYGTPCTTPRRHKQLMEEAGFVDVQEHVLKLPIGPWAKDKRQKKVGAFELVNMVDGIEGLTIRLFSKALGMSIEEIQLLMVDIRKEAKNSKIHSFYHFWVVYGRRPTHS